MNCWDSGAGMSYMGKVIVSRWAITGDRLYSVVFAGRLIRAVADDFGNLVEVA